MKKFLALLFLLTFSAISLSGCWVASMFDSDNWPTVAPAKNDLVGEWKISAESLQKYQSKGIALEQSAVLQLKSDGNFIFEHYLDCDTFATKCADKNISGTWKINYQNKEYYNLVLVYATSENSSKIFSIGIWNKKSPYLLWTFFGDLDDGNYVFYEKVAN